jgi:hypothetical protein
MHTLQKVLLKRLQLQNNQRYGTLAAGYDFEDNIVFHLNKLISNNFISKEDGVYSLTLSGVKEVSKYQPMELENKGVKTFFIGFICKDEHHNYLIKSHPNAKEDFYNLPSGKPCFGESIDQSLTRVFKLNTGIELQADKFEFTSLHLKTIKSSDGEIIFDDAFTIYSLQISDEQKIKMKLMDSISWKPIDEIRMLNNKWPEIDICILEHDLTIYKSYIHISDYIL